uniref:Uncharacterized protein n=1 Tax=viral metagenome TaxID=1070528 RepID=A0A6C0I0N7_9ZZZZ
MPVLLQCCNNPIKLLNFLKDDKNSFADDDDELWF